jgi:hypothetical protein
VVNGMYESDSRELLRCGRGSLNSAVERTAGGSIGRVCRYP